MTRHADAERARSKVAKAESHRKAKEFAEAAAKEVQQMRESAKGQEMTQIKESKYSATLADRIKKMADRPPGIGLTGQEASLADRMGATAAEYYADVEKQIRADIADAEHRCTDGSGDDEDPDPDPGPEEVFGSYHRMGLNLGALVASKQDQYGDSAGRSGRIMEVLYPGGIRPHQYDDALLVVRVLDKLSRIAQRGADGKDLGGESPWKDIAGYGLLGWDKDGES